MNEIKRSAKILISQALIECETILKHILETRGYLVVCAKSEIETIYLMQRNNFDILIIEISPHQEEKVNEILNTWKKITKENGIALILMSTARENVQSFMEDFPFVGFVQEPLSILNLFSEIDSALVKKSLRGL